MKDQQEIELATPTECELIRQIASGQLVKSTKPWVWVTDERIFAGVVFQPE